MSFKINIETITIKNVCDMMLLIQDGPSNNIRIMAPRSKITSFCVNKEIDIRSIGGNYMASLNF